MANDTQDPPPADETGRPTGPRGAALRRRLLAQLPALEYRGAAMLEALKLDEASDLRGAIELDADAFLAPLELTMRQGGGRPWTPR